MDTNSWDLAFLAQLKMDFALLAPTLALSGKGQAYICADVLQFFPGEQQDAFQVFDVTNSSNSLGATSEWWQWRLHCPVIHLSWLLMKRFPVTPDRTLLIALLTGSLILICPQTQTCPVPKTLYALYPQLPKKCKMLPVYRTLGLAKSSASLTLI